MGEGFDYAEEFKTLDLERGEEGHQSVVDDIARLVAGRLRKLWPVLHSHGLA